MSDDLDTLVEWLDNLFAMLEEEGYHTKANTADFARKAITTLRTQLAEVKAELGNANKIMDDWTTLHRVIADIRDASGLGSRPMLSDLATEIGRSLATSNARADRAEAEISRLTDLNSTAYIDGHDAAKNEYRDEIRRLEVLNAQLTVMSGEDAVEQIEAERAAQIEVDAGILQAVADNWDCGHSDSRYCRCAELAEQWCIAADEIRNQPHDRSALDAVRRAAKVEAWKEAEVATLGLATGHGCRTAILALIEGWGKS